MSTKIPLGKDSSIRIGKTDNALISEFIMPRARAFGYAKATLKNLRNFLLRAARLQAARGRTLRTLSHKDVPAILRCVPACVIAGMRAALQCLLKFQGKPISEGGKQLWRACADDYRRFMLEQCGFSQETCRHYSDAAHHFLNWRFGAGPVRWRALTVRDILRYAHVRIRGLRPISAKLYLIRLRRFLQWTHLRGYCPIQLVHAVPMVACFRMSASLATLTDAQRSRLLSSFARDAQGRCERAMTACMVDLGLRVSEVALLRTDDIDWSEHTLRVPAVKGGTIRLVPIPVRMIGMLRHYINHVRPKVDCTMLFLRSAKLVGKPVSVSVIKMAVRRAYRRCHFPEHWTGVHILRRTFATRLSRRGASMREIGDLLGHKKTEVTGRYTAVDLRDLRCVTQPWPR